MPFFSLIFISRVGSASASVHMSVTTPSPNSVYSSAASTTLPANLDKMPMTANGDEAVILGNDTSNHSRSSSKKSNHSIHSLPGK